MAEIPTNITQWTFRTALIAFFLALMASTAYLYKENVKLYEKINTANETRVEKVLQLLECKAELQAAKERR